MMSPIFMEEYAKERLRERLKECEAWRIARQVKAAQPAQPGLIERIVNGVGILLTDASERLTEHHALLR